ncbi:hypothetical protein QQF64_003513 [Cirrhinus molitorella]|uniref:Uncharacterized protein n=1 Tax=Cirrhinus molitorella TaxID=172907 RepID=A0ABR3MLI6_9TELE
MYMHRYVHDDTNKKCPETKRDSTLLLFPLGGYCTIAVAYAQSRVVSPPYHVVLADTCRVTGWDWLIVTSSLQREQRETGRRQNVPGYCELYLLDEGLEEHAGIKLKDTERAVCKSDLFFWRFCRQTSDEV